MIKLKSITDKSWLVMTSDGVDKVGLLSEQQDKFVLMTKSVKTTFHSKNEINEFFNEDVFNDQIVVETLKESGKEHFINGFPVDFINPLEVEVISDLPVFSKTSTSTVHYSAGYYCLRFPKGWMSSFCPKVSTLDKYKYSGPFRTKKEMKFVLAKLRRESGRN